MIERQTHPQVGVYLDELAEALGSRAQAKKIQEEVRADLADLVESYQKEGRSEEKAVELALEELGNPYELAHRMIREIPPFGGIFLSTLRYLAAGAVIVWTAMVLWSIRAGQYGFELTLPAVVIFLHLPAILLLWPRFVWKRNWLFGWLPAMAVFAAVMLLSTGGVEMEASVIPLEAEWTEPPPRNSEKATVRWIAVGLTSMSVFLLLALQQRSQRRWAIAMVLFVAGAVEICFQVEESWFRREYKELDLLVNRELPGGGLPSEQELQDKLGRNSHFFRHDEQDYSLFWDRPLSPGHALIYSSREARIRVQD